MRVANRETEPETLSEVDLDLARAAQRCVMEALDHSRAVSIVVAADDGSVPQVELPPAVLREIGKVLGLMSSGKPIVMMPRDQELSTVEAANMLNVSRPFVIKEIEAGRLKHRKVGAHRRILLEDLIAYRDAMRRSQQDALDRLAALNDEMGLEY